MISVNITPNLSSGDVFGTDFTFTETITSVNTIVKRIWDFGDGIKKYNIINPSHTYVYPGTYNVTLSVYDIIGNFSKTETSVAVDYVYRDYITFTSIPQDYSVPGQPTATPFKVSLTSAQINTPIIVDLYAANSQTTPYETVPGKWNFLTPTWRFLNRDLTPVTSLSVDTINLYKDNKVVGVSGEIEFYFVDDKCSGSISNPESKCPFLITATLQTSGFNFPPDSRVTSYPSYANNEAVRTGLIWNVYTVIPTHLKVTGNYIEDVYPYKWTGIKAPFLITAHSNKKNYLQGSESIESGILFTIPETNAIGNLSPVVVSLSNTNAFTIDEAPLYFQSTDNNGFDTGGYIFSTLTPLTAISTTNIVATATLFLNQESNIGQFAYPRGCSPNVFAWISNPANKTLHKVFLPPYPNNCDTINAFKNSNNLIDGYIKTLSVPGISAASTYNYYMSGFSGIYGLAIDPRQHDMYATDAELDCIYKFSNTGTLLSTLQLSSIGGFSPISGAYTPSNVCIDGNYNIYVSLFNTVSVLKFDENLNFLYNLVPSLSTYNISDGDFVHKPSMVETDRENNVWVSYSNPISSLLIKYDGTTGTPLITIPQPYGSPVSLAITVDNNIWVANSYNTTLDEGLLQLYSSIGTLISTVSGYTHPGYLSLDKYDNLWFTFETRKIGYISKNISLTSDDFQWPAYGWALELDGTFTPYITATSINNSTITVNRIFENLTPELTSVNYDKDEELGGLAVDVFNRIWILDSINNKITIVQNIEPTDRGIGSTIRTIKIYPDSLLGFYLDLDATFTYTLTSEYYKSIQANGDWTGNRWYQKYFNPTALTAVSVSGISTPFVVNNFVNDGQVRLLNDSFDTAAHYKSLAVPDILSRHTIFFDTFLGAVVGNSQLSASDDIGRIVYEKIANFISTHGDIDTCNIRQLLSYAEETATPAFDYGTDFPPEIQKYLDIVSTPRNRLYGLKSPQPILQSSVGPEINTQTEIVSAGEKIFLRNRYDGKDLNLVTIPVLNNQYVYPLSSLTLQGFSEPIFQKYIFFKYVPVFSDKFIENYIDWESPYTALSPNLSSQQELYGDKGIIENTFNYLLTKNIIVK